MSHKRASTFRRRARRGNHSYWRWVRGSNPWPLQWQCNALAWTELTHQKRTGILIRSFPNNRQLSYEHGGCRPTFDGERKEMISYISSTRGVSFHELGYCPCHSRWGEQGGFLTLTVWYVWTFFEPLFRFLHIYYNKYLRILQIFIVGGWYRTRTYSLPVNSRLLHHWANHP